MATEVGSAFISLLPSMQGFSSKVNKDIGGISERAGRDGGARFGKMWASASISPMRAVGTAAVGLFAAAQVGQFFKESIAGARESAKIGALTAQVIKTTGAAANVSAAQVGNLAAAISNKTGVDDEAIQSGSNLLLTFTKVQNQVGKGNDIFNRATMAATDMSVALGTDLKSSSMLVGKALNDPVKGMTALTRSGIQFTAAQKAQITAMAKSGNVMGAQKMILAELTTQFGGAAAAAGTPADRARVAWGNFQEFLGGKMLPVADKLSAFFTGTLLPGLQATFTAFESGRATGAGFMGFMSNLGVKAQQLGVFFQTTVVPALKEFGSFLGAEVLPRVVALGGFLTGTVVPALAQFAGWVQRNAQAIKVVAGIIGTLFIPRLIVMGVTATQSGIAQVRAWVATQVAAVKSSAASFASSYKVVAGWVASGAAATVAGARIAATYVAQGVAAVASGAVQAGAWARATAAMVANRAIMIAAAVATGVMTAAQWALNVALTANPIGLVVLAVVALVAALVIAYNKSETFRNIVQGAMSGVATAFGWVMDAAKSVFNWVKSNWPLLLAIIAGPIGIAILLAVKYWGKLKAGALSAWNGIKAIVRIGVGLVVGYFSDMKEKAAAKMDQLVAFVKGIPGKILGFFSDMKAKMLAVGGNIVDGLKNGISNAWGRVTAFIGRMVDKIPKKIREMLGIASPSKVTAEIGKWVSIGLAVGIASRSKDVVAAAGKMTDQLRKALYAKTPGASVGLLRTVERENRALLRLASQREAVSKRLAAATKSYAGLVKARTDYGAGVADSARQFAAITTVESQGRVSTKSVLDNLRSRMVKVQQFADLIKRLKAQGLNATTLDQIVQSGVEQGQGIAAALAQGGTNAIAEANKLQAGISSAANGLGVTAGSAMYDAGVNAAAGIVRGLRSQEKVLAAQMARLARIMAQQIKKSLKIKSPSRVMADEVGKFIPLGIARGISRHAGAVASEMDRMARVPQMPRSAVRGPLVTAGAVGPAPGGGDTFKVYSNASDPHEVARQVAAENSWRKR